MIAVVPVKHFAQFVDLIKRSDKDRDFDKRGKSMPSARATVRIWVKTSSACAPIPACCARVPNAVSPEI
jgi:hydroxyacyl-ACP dehydratase HTD2-like protein with hotdog domain